MGLGMEGLSHILVDVARRVGNDSLGVWVSDDTNVVSCLLCEFQFIQVVRQGSGTSKTWLYNIVSIASHQERAGAGDVLVTSRHVIMNTQSCLSTVRFVCFF